MGCNGNNHRPDCTCPFRGGYKDHAHQNPWQQRHAEAARLWSIRAESFTIPNARCPQCRAQVFFYSSPDGGKVFFDDLGPPWPKHPCTDSGPKSTRPAGAAFQRLVSRDNGWRLFIYDRVETVPERPGLIRLIGQEHGGRPFRLYAVLDGQRLRKEFACWLHSARAGVYEVSTLDGQTAPPAELRFAAYLALPHGGDDAGADVPIKLLRRIPGKQASHETLTPRASRREPVLPPPTRNQPALRRRDGAMAAQPPTEGRRPTVTETRPKKLEFAANVNSAAESISATQIALNRARGMSKAELHQQKLLHKIKMAKLRGK